MKRQAITWIVIILASLALGFFVDARASATRVEAVVSYPSYSVENGLKMQNVGS